MCNIVTATIVVRLLFSLDDKYDCNLQDLLKRCYRSIDKYGNLVLEVDVIKERKDIRFGTHAYAVYLVREDGLTASIGSFTITEELLLTQVSPSQTIKFAAKSFLKSIPGIQSIDFNK